MVQEQRKPTASAPAPTASAPEPAAADPAPLELDSLLRLMTARGASDLHLKPTRPPLLRIAGRLVPLAAPPLRPDEHQTRWCSASSSRIRRPGSTSGCRSTSATASTAWPASAATSTCSAAPWPPRSAASPTRSSSVEDLELPPVLLDFCDLPMGLVLITGPTGSGKSTTLAAMIRHIVTHRPVHVITIEDPMEFLFTDDVASHLAARGGHRHGELLGGAAQRHAPGSRRHHGRRDARPGDRLHGDHRRRDRPPGVLDPAHQQRRADRRPHPRHLPPRAAGAGPRPARPGAQGGGVDEAGRAPGRQRPGRGPRDHAGLAEGRQDDREGRDPAAASKRSSPRSATTGCSR